MPSCSATSALTASVQQPHVAVAKDSRGPTVGQERPRRMRAHLAGNDQGPSEQQLCVGSGRGQQGPAARSKAGALCAVKGGLVRAGQRPHDLARTHCRAGGDRGLHADARLSLDADRLQHHCPGRHPEGPHLGSERGVILIHRQNKVHNRCGHWL